MISEFISEVKNKEEIF